MAVDYVVGNFYVVLYLKKLEKRHVLEEAMRFRNQWKESVKHALYASCFRSEAWAFCAQLTFTKGDMEMKRHIIHMYETLKL